MATSLRHRRRRSGPVPILIRFPVSRTGAGFGSDHGAVEVTGDVAAASRSCGCECYQHDRELEWLKPNGASNCFRPAERNTRESHRARTVEVHVRYRTLDQPPSARRLGRNGSARARRIARRSRPGAEDGTVDVQVQAPRSGVRQEETASMWRFSRGRLREWRVALDGLKLVIEHRLLSRRDTPRPDSAGRSTTARSASS